MRQFVKALSVFGLVLALSGTAYAGPIVIDGTDANDHGSVSAGVNQEGWEYMQRVLENLASQLGVGPAHAVLTLGLSGGQAGAAYDSAFGLSSLASSGWTSSNADGAAAITAALASLSTATTGILYLPTASNSSGDLTTTEMAAVNAGALQIANFVNSGGALFAMAETGTGAWGWLTTLLPGLVATDVGAGGVGSSIVLTADGFAAFPAITATDIDGAVPWHSYFSGALGSLKVLGTAVQGGQTRAVIIGGGAGTVITAVPEPGTMLLVGTGAVALLLRARRRKN